jgi:CDP-diacylglycerol--glycerol-3-phosphate 3-phosphatidyltransferase
LGSLKLFVRSAAAPLVRGLVALGVTANVLTLGGFSFNVIAGLVVALGALPLGGLLYLLFSSLDFLDGAVARVSGTAGPFGAFLDSVLDRASEASVLVGLVYWYAGQQQPLVAAVSGMALTGSFLVSYARARAEGLGYECEVGWLQRTERIILLGLGLLLSGLHPLVVPSVLGVLALATAATTVQRIRHVAEVSRPERSRC